jgi:hypothetical protein
LKVEELIEKLSEYNKDLDIYIQGTLRYNDIYHTEPKIHLYDEIYWDGDTYEGKFVVLEA